MGIYDRDYYRAPMQQPRAPFGGMRVWTVTTWLIVINVAVFFIDSVIRLNYYRYGQWREDGLLSIWGHFSVETANQRVAMLDD